MKMSECREHEQVGGDSVKKVVTVQRLGKLNEVYRSGDRGPCGAYHTYIVARAKREPGKNPIIALVKFQKGPRNDPGARTGVLDCDLIEIVRDRLKAFQEGEFSTAENEAAIFHLEQALQWMNRRVEDRIERGVLGKMEK